MSPLRRPDDRLSQPAAAKRRRRLVPLRRKLLWFVIFPHRGCHDSCCRSDRARHDGRGGRKRLVDNGVKVLTSLKGRSAETAARSRAAGMAAASDEEIAASDFVLSILPPGDAVALAERFQPALKASNSKPVYVDCNAINPKTVDRVAAVIAPTDCPFVDSGIIGSPPTPLPNPPPLAGEGRVAGSPRFYASGAAAPRFATLRQYGLDVRVLDGALSAASALKMSYAGITKGT